MKIGEANADRDRAEGTATELRDELEAAKRSAEAALATVRLDPELKRDLILRAAQDGISVSEVIRQAVRQYLPAS